MSSRTLKVYPTHMMARNAFIEEFNKKDPYTKYKVPSLTIESANGDTTMYVSAEFPDRMRGLYFDKVHIHEMIESHRMRDEWYLLERPSESKDGT